MVNDFRCSGSTTLTILYSLWKCLFNLEKKVFYTSNTDRSCRETSRIVKTAIENLSNFLKADMGVDNYHEKEFVDTGSSMIFYSPQATRSRSVDWSIIDNASYINNFEDHWKGMQPTFWNGNVILIFTPNGQKFNKLWRDKNLNPWKYVKLNSLDHPDLKDKLRREEISNNLGEKVWRQEILGEFLQ